MCGGFSISFTNSFFYCFCLFLGKLQLQGTLRYVNSKRGTKHLLFDGNTYTPNDKKVTGRKDWKCSQYYKKHCRARIQTLDANSISSGFRVLTSVHSHDKIYKTKDDIEFLLNYR